MRLVMMGTGSFGLPSLELLVRSSHVVAAVFTQPLSASPGRRKAPPAPLREAATEWGIPLADPPNVNSTAGREALARFEPELLVVADYGQILSSETLAVAPQGGINLHGSLLPRYRGAAPVNWAIFHGEHETGVTVFQMTPRVDAGPALAIRRTPIGPLDTAPQLKARLAEMGAAVVLEAIEALQSGRIEPVSQDAQRASRAPKLRKEDGLVCWSRSATDIANQVRAFVPWPKTFTFWHRPDRESLRLVLVQVCPQQDASAASPGEVIEAAGERLVVATRGGSLAIERIQPAGKRVLAAGEFLRGYRIRPGERLGAST